MTSNGGKQRRSHLILSFRGHGGALLRVMTKSCDGPNPRHLTSRVRTAAPGARFQWLNSQLSSLCRPDAMSAKGHPKNDKARTAAAKPASASCAACRRAPDTDAQKCRRCLPPCTRHKRVAIVRAARRYKARSLRASRLRSGHRVSMGSSRITHNVLRG